MIKKMFLYILLYLIFVTPIYAVRSLPAGAQPESIEGEATGTFPKLRGPGTLTFINIGDEARLVAICGELKASAANSVTCTGIDVIGTFTGGPNDIAVFNTGSGGEVKLQLNK